MKVGIESAAFYVPSLYLDIREFAEKRDMEPEKLEKGLGLKKMSFPDVHEDAATMASNALLQLILDFNILPEDIATMYLGTESALDASKPTATYVLNMIEGVLAEKFGERCFKNCDVTDFTFACIGGVDALHCALDFVRGNPGKKAVVIASDYAKYELGSSGEYTQGAGSVALLISDKPHLLEIENERGVSTESVFDFFKPRRIISKNDIKSTSEKTPDILELFSEEPVFDGQYSNECFKARIREAYEHFKQQIPRNICPFDEWRYLIFHLPYAFHAKRIFTEIFGKEKNLPCRTDEQLKEVSRSEEYKKLVSEKIEPTQRASSEIGNMYTASIFMALISALQTSYEKKEILLGKRIGFLAYGSGSKSKVFQGKVGENWGKIVEKWNLFDGLSKRKVIDLETYEKLHKKQLKESILTDYKGFGLEKIEQENPLLKGARYYRYK